MLCFTFKLQGVKSLKHLKPDSKSSGCHYMHPDSINDFYEALKAVTEADLEADRLASPYHIYGISADEATDSANLSVIFIYINYIDITGIAKTRFMGVKQLEGTTATAEHIFTAITELLEKKKLPKHEMVGMATDGAGNMVGVRKGVTTRFKQEIQHLITNHCMAHRLQLASEKSANQVPVITKYIAVLNQFAKSLKFSPKLCRILEVAKDLNGVKSKKIKQVFFTRWLSFQDSVQALAGCVDAVISCLYEAAADPGSEVVKWPPTLLWP